ncbi:MAG: C_GCAxxG_C_C family protein [Bacteroidales bacterium]|nr:C_GCAxxG_C_C family protein [Candidatus Colicola faecequi]
MQINEEARVERARELFMEGYNCSQSVAITFADIYDIDEELMSRISASFGGGIGRMRETCGAACGMFLLAGLKSGPYPSAENKMANYADVQTLAEQFKEQTGSLICRELLGLNKQRKDGTLEPVVICAKPDERTAEYYAKRPCLNMVETAVRLYCRRLQKLQ